MDRDTRQRNHRRTALAPTNITGGSTIEGAWRARSRFATAPRPACRAVRGLRPRTLRGRLRRRLTARWRDGDGRYGRRRDQWAADRRPGDRSPSAYRRSRGALPAPSCPGACRHPPRRRSGRHGGTADTGPGGRVDRLAGLGVPRVLPCAAAGRYGSTRSPSMSCGSVTPRTRRRGGAGRQTLRRKAPGDPDALSSKAHASARTRGSYRSAPFARSGRGTNNTESRPQPGEKVTLAPNGAGLFTP